MLQRISTGSDTADNVLGGGIPLESIVLIYGEAKTGKTTLALQLAVNCAEKGYKTLFLDCDGTFSVRRFTQIISGRPQKIAPLIYLVKPNSFREQTLVIDQLSDYLTKSFKLVVIDSFSSLYSIEIAGSPSKTFELNRELNRQMAFLAQASKIKKIAVVTTSQVRSAFNETYVSIEPVATRVLKFWANLIIALKPTGNQQIIKAILEKRPKSFLPVTCYLEIGEKGLQDTSC